MLIAYIWTYGNKTAILSRENESFLDFKKRAESCYPTPEWHHQYSEFNEIH